MLSCSRSVRHYAIVLYDKSRLKEKTVQEIAEELPAPPVISYFPCDSWYTCGGNMGAFIKKGFLHHWYAENEPGTVSLRHKAENQ